MRYGYLFMLALLIGFVGCDKPDRATQLADAREAYEARDLKKAARILEAGAETAPDDPDVLVGLARTKLELGDLAAAQAALAKAAEVAGGDIDVRLLAAQLAWLQKDFAQAARLYGAIADDATLCAAERAQGWAGLGVVRMGENEPHLARVAFLRAIRADRRNAAAWYHLGVLYRDSFGYLEAALEQFSIYVRLEAEADVRVQKVQRSVIPAVKDALARAAAARPNAARRDRAAGEAKVAKAEGLVKKGGAKNLAMARTAYQEALKADPLSSAAAQGLAALQIRLATTSAAKEAALESYKTACALSPSSVRLYLTTGDLAFRLGHAVQAVEIFSRAVAADPSNISALDGLIRAFQKVGKRAIAQAYQDYRTSLGTGRRR